MTKDLTMPEMELLLRQMMDVMKTTQSVQKNILETNIALINRITALESQVKYLLSYLDNPTLVPPQQTKP